MIQPVWITAGGSLGTVPEGVYYDVTVSAVADVGETVFYKIIAGSLPTNTYCDIEGNITGIPSTEVTAGQDVVVTGAQFTSMFTVRAYTTLNNQATGTVRRICDRTFTVTIVSKNTPAWITPAGSIGSFYDGTLLEPGYQFLYTDNPLPGVTPITLVSGQLPPGITISGTGLLSGYFTPNPAISTLAGYSRDGQPYSPDPPTVYKFDFNTQSESYTYQFTLQVTNGVQRELRTFTMSIWNPSLFTADAVTISYVGNPPVRNTDPMSADNTQLPASISSVIPPVVLNPQGSIGTYRNDNFFAYRFNAYDYSNNPVIFEGFDLPPGLTLDATTGWLYGYIPDLGITEETYNFDIRVSEPFDINPYTVSELYSYSVTFVGAIATEITWISPQDLGTIDNGSTSTFTVKAVDSTGLLLQYRIKSGSNSKLPQGLSLLPSGNIVGRVSFIMFALDDSTTIFDSGATTFDLTYTFTVNAYSTNGVVSVFRNFTIRIRDAYPQPYNNLYISCMPPRADRTLIQNLLQNTDIFPPSLLYRVDDPNFGVAKSVVYNHAYGLTAATIDSYVRALELNHYWKNLVLGEIRTAQALDDLGNIIYEVVYSTVIDDQVNASGESVSKIVPLPYPVNADTIFEIDDVYPNSLQDMRDQVIDTVGQVSNILPRWMYSKQKDGRVLGFTPAWVIAYTAPNASGQIAYNIQQQFGADQLNLIDFKADRYELDRSMTLNWDPIVTAVSIESITSNGTTATITYATTPAVTILPGETITVTGVVPTAYNKNYYVIASNSNQITVSSAQTETAVVTNAYIQTLPHWVPSPAVETTFDVKNHYELHTINIDPPVGSGYSIGNVLVTSGNYFANTPVTIFGNTAINSTTVATTEAALSMIGAKISGATIPTGTTVIDATPGVNLIISANATANTTSPELLNLVLLAPEYDATYRVCQVSDTGAIEEVFCSGVAPYDVSVTNLVLPVDNVLVDSEANPPNTVITFDTQSVPPFPSGSTVLIAHANPPSYNGTYTVGASGVNRITIAGVNTQQYIGGATICNVRQWSAAPAVLAGEEPAATSTSANITQGPSATVFGTISGTKLTRLGGNPAVGQILSSGGVAIGTYIIAPIFGVLTSSTTYILGSDPGTGTLAGHITYSNVSQKSTSGIGTGATWDIRKNNTTTSYDTLIITLVEGGENYAIDDTIIIAGTSLGGTTPANDLTFTLGGSVSNNKCWTVNISQTIATPTTMVAKIFALTVSGTTTGIFTPGQYITGNTITGGTQITTQLISTTTPIATTTAVSSVNSRIITVTSTASIAVGQIVNNPEPTIVPQGTFVDSIDVANNKVTLSQALNTAGTRTYEFKAVGGAGTYAVDIAQLCAEQDIIATDVIFDVIGVPGQETVFDAGSLEFVNPADNTTNTNTADRYLLYPKDNVINNLPQSATWLNNNEDPVGWENDQSPPNPEAFWNT